MGEHGEKGIYLMGTGDQRPKFEGNKDQYWGTGNIRNQIFDFRGTREKANLFQGTMEHVPPPTHTPWSASFIKGNQS